jgi:hypothetical protein
MAVPVAGTVDAVLELCTKAQSGRDDESRSRLTLAAKEQAMYSLFQCIAWTVHQGRPLALAGLLFTIAQQPARGDDEAAATTPTSSSGVVAAEAGSPSPELLAPANTLEEKTPTDNKSTAANRGVATEETKPVATSTDKDEAADDSESEAVTTDSAVDTTRKADADTAEVARENDVTANDEEPDNAQPADRASRTPARNLIPPHDPEPGPMPIGDSADRARPMRSIVRPSRDAGAGDFRELDDVPPEALPAPDAARDADDRHVNRRHSALGIYLRPDTRDAVIEDVAPRSAAAAAGLRRGDLITWLDGDPVESAEDFFTIAEQLPAGSNPKISVSRTIDVRLRTSDSPQAVRAARYDLDPSRRPPDSGQPYEEPAPRVRILVPAPRDDNSAPPPERRDDRRGGLLLRGRLLGR